MGMPTCKAKKRRKKFKCLQIFFFSKHHLVNLTDKRKYTRYWYRHGSPTGKEHRLLSTVGSMQPGTRENTVKVYISKNVNHGGVSQIHGDKSILTTEKNEVTKLFKAVSPRRKTTLTVCIPISTCHNKGISGPLYYWKFQRFSFIISWYTRKIA